GLVKVHLTPIPLSLSSRDISERFRNPAAIWQELARLVKVTHRSVVILQAGIMIEALGQDGFAKVGLKGESLVGCLPCLFPQGVRWLQSHCAIPARLHE